MATLLLICIFLCFAGMGLYGSVFGAVWPVLHLDFGVSIDLASIFPLITTIGNILIGLLFEKINKKFSYTKISIFSMTMIILITFTIGKTNNFYLLMLLALPVGMAVGGLDIAVNNYLALYYKPQAMSWGHCSWGVGALASPLIAAKFLGTEQWRPVYFVVGSILLVVLALMLIIRPYWEKEREPVNKIIVPKTTNENVKLTVVPGFTAGLIMFFLMSATSSIISVWGSSYLVINGGITPETGARVLAAFFAAMMISRFIAGFVAMVTSYNHIVVFSQVLIILGAGILLVSGGARAAIFPAFVLIGLGIGPMFPGIIALTTERYGSSITTRVISKQMSASYIGSALFPQLVGIISSKLSVGLGIIPLLIILLILGVFSLNLHIKRVTT